MSNLIKSLRDWKEVITITLFTKLFLLFFAAYYNQNLHDLFNPWIRWDGPHYIEIAKNWYQISGEPALFIVFYPLYPLLIRLANFLFNDFYLSAIFVAIFFSFLSSAALFKLTLLDFNKKTALASVWFFNIFPTAFFLQASYTESLFLFLSIMTVYQFRKGKFLESGLWGALSSLTRVNGLLLIPMLFLELKNIKKSLAALILIPVGFLIYLYINYISFGEFFYFTKPLQSNWFKRLAFPEQGIRYLINQLSNLNDPNYYIYAWEMAAILFILFMGIFIFLRIRKSYGVYVLLSLILFASTSFILSTPRYALSLFPIFIAFGTIKNKIIFTFLSAISIFLLLYLTIIYTKGGWAF